MGAIAERPKTGATVGETFSCLIGKCNPKTIGHLVVLFNFKFSSVQ